MRWSIPWLFAWAERHAADTWEAKGISETPCGALAAIAASNRETDDALGAAEGPATATAAPVWAAVADWEARMASTARASM